MRELGEGLGGVAIGPATLILQRLRQVPVVERDVWRDPALQQRVDQARIVVQPGLVHAPVALRQDARPGEREAVGVEVELRHQVHVALPAMVMVAGDVAVCAIVDHAGFVAEAVPDGLALAVLGRRPLDLVCRRRRPPREIRRETTTRHLRLTCPRLARHAYARLLHPVALPLNLSLAVYHATSLALPSRLCHAHAESPIPDWRLCYT